MEKEILRRYELVIILDAKLPPDEKETISKDVVEVITNQGGKVINKDVWIEKQKFTFPIKKQEEGTYYLINFDGQAACIVKIRTALRLNEKILRSSIIKVETN